MEPAKGSPTPTHPKCDWALGLCSSPCQAHPARPQPSLTAVAGLTSAPVLGHVQATLMEAMFPCSDHRPPWAVCGSQHAHDLWTFNVN